MSEFTNDEGFETLDNVRGMYRVNLKEVTWREWFVPVTLETIDEDDIIIAMDDLSESDEVVHQQISEFLFEYNMGNIPKDDDTKKIVVDFVNIAKKYMDEESELIRT